MDPKLELRVATLKEVIGDETRRVIDWSKLDPEELILQIEAATTNLNNFNPRNTLGLSLANMNEDQWICVIQGAAATTLQLLASKELLEKKLAELYAGSFRGSFNDLAKGISSVRPFSTGSRG